MKIKPLLTLVLLINLFSLSGCKIEGARKYSTEDFIYCYIKEPGSSIIGKPESCDYVAILELTEVGKTKDVIIIPEEIDGRPVVQIGAVGFGYRYELDFDMRKSSTSIYLPKTIVIDVTHSISGNDNPALPFKVYLVDLDKYEYLNYGPIIHVSKELYRKCVSNNIIDEETGYAKGGGSTLKIANISFISENETYFIANYDEGEKITYIPEDPVRTDYTFDGWYKEEECINKWNFENDIVAFDATEKILKLYAKWI